MRARAARLRKDGRTEEEVASYLKVFETGAKYHLVRVDCPCSTIGPAPLPALHELLRTCALVSSPAMLTRAPGGPQVHSAVLLCAPACRLPGFSCGLLSGGTVLFCGSLYAVAAAGSREGLQAKLAPFGGGLLILGWLAFIL